jgi:Na+-transporting NADH:ubiquinone oxidoreductase subunit NqrD
LVNINQIVGAVIALVIVGAIAGVGISSINNANTTGWTSEQVLLFGLIATFFVIGLLVAFIPKLSRKMGGD